MLPKQQPAREGADLYLNEFPDRQARLDEVAREATALGRRVVTGIHDLTPTGLTQAFGTIAGRVTGQDQMERGVVVQVGEVECIVDLNIIVDYEASIPQVAEAIRRNISNRLQAMAGLQTKEVNINVADLYFPGQEEQQPQPQQTAVR